MPTGNFSFVIDSSFKPFSMEEIMAPLVAYKQVYDQTEAAYDELTKGADTFKYLAKNVDPDSKAAQIYNNYASELNKQAEDLAAHGLSMSNRRALTNLKRRYQGEIGLLEQAKTALDKENELRRSSKDPSMLYAVDNLTIDDFLGDRTPNLYSVSADELYKRGTQVAQSSSSRIYSDTKISNLTNYFQEIVQNQGYSPELLEAFRTSMESIPEFRQAVDDILVEKGVNKNLSGINYERARQSVINGILDGAVYKETRNVKDNPGVLTAAQAASDARQRESQRLSAAMSGMVLDSSSPTGYRYDIRQDPKQADNLWMYDIDENGRVRNYSKDYWEKLEKGTINVNGTPKTPTQTKTPTQKLPKLQERVGYDENGNSIELKSSGTIAGEPITKAEAIARFPGLADKITKHDLKYPGYYKYYAAPVAGSTGRNKKYYLIIEPNNVDFENDFYAGTLQTSIPVNPTDATPQVPEGGQF